jgi:inner membrane protein
MPSPLGHALGGLAAGWVVVPPSIRSRNWTDAAWFAAAGVAADLDLLAGAHSGPTHSIGAAALVGLATFLARSRGRFALAVSAAYASHILLDWLGSDGAPPIGIMALWPFTREYYESRFHVFYAISRRYWLPDFWVLNMRALAREAIVLVPATALIGYVRFVASCGFHQRRNQQDIRRSGGINRREGDSG